MIRKLLVALRWAANHPVNGGSKFRGMADFIRAQIGAKLVAGDVCVALPNDTRLLVSPQMKGAFHYIWPGLYDFEEMSFVVHFLRPEDVFVDAGANIGVFTILASGAAGARSIAFEPGPSAFSYLKSNILLNSLSQCVSARNIALGGREGRTRFTTGLGTENTVTKEGNDLNSVEVDLSTLDRQLDGIEPVVIKIDVEGYEQEVLAGGRNILAKPSVRALIVERVGNASGPDEAALHAHIRSLDFVPCAYSPLTRSLTRVPDDTAGCNIIYIRDLASANKRLSEARAYQFAGRSI